MRPLVSPGQVSTPSADYSGGVAIFTMARGGLMYEATVGGQKFAYEAR